MENFKLTAPREHNGQIPYKYSCDGENINPPLTIEWAPEGTQSLVLLMDDPDIPDFVKERNNIEMRDHRVVFNMPADTKEIQEATTPPGKQGRNTGWNNAYGWPCPPDKEHRYFFKLYALDVLLDLPEGATKADVENAMKWHIIAQTELIWRYERQ